MKYEKNPTIIEQLDEVKFSIVKGIIKSSGTEKKLKLTIKIDNSHVGTITDAVANIKIVNDAIKTIPFTLVKPAKSISGFGTFEGTYERELKNQDNSPYTDPINSLNILTWLQFESDTEGVKRSEIVGYTITEDAKDLDTLPANEVSTAITDIFKKSNQPSKATKKKLPMKKKKQIITSLADLADKTGHKLVAELEGKPEVTDTEFKAKVMIKNKAWNGQHDNVKLGVQFERDGQEIGSVDVFDVGTLHKRDKKIIDIVLKFPKGFHATGIKLRAYVPE